MTTYLLDVNVLIALIDSNHVHFLRAHKWFHEEGIHSWLTCPITEIGIVHVVSGGRYPDPVSPADAILSLRSLTELGKHAFVADSPRLLDPSRFDHQALLTSLQLTNSYLLALAAAHNASLATFDKRLVTSAVRSEQKRIHLIP